MKWEKRYRAQCLPAIAKVKVSVALSCPTLLNPMDCRLLCWAFPGKNTGMGCHFLLQGIFPTQGLNSPLLCFLHWQADSWPSEPPGKPVQAVNAKKTWTVGRGQSTGLSRAILTSELHVPCYHWFGGLCTMGSCPLCFPSGFLHLSTLGYQWPPACLIAVCVVDLHANSGHFSQSK